MCGRCVKRNTECMYEIEDDKTTKMQHVNQQIEVVDAEYRRLMQVFNALQRAPDDVASVILARIRAGESYNSIAASLPPGQPP